MGPLFSAELFFAGAGGKGGAEQNRSDNTGYPYFFHMILHEKSIIYAIKNGQVKKEIGKVTRGHQ